MARERLTQEQVLAIRQAYMAGTPMAALANSYGRGIEAIRAVVRNEAYHDPCYTFVALPRGVKERQFPPKAAPPPQAPFEPPTGLSRCPVDGSRYWADEWTSASGWAWSCMAAGHQVFAPYGWRPTRLGVAS